MSDEPVPYGVVASGASVLVRSGVQSIMCVCTAVFKELHMPLTGYLPPAVSASILSCAAALPGTHCNQQPADL